MAAVSNINVSTPIDDMNGNMTFRLINSEISVANAIRRTLLSNINCLVFKGFPHEENQINIKKNSSRFNNEYLKHRISCIPIYEDDDTKFVNIMNDFIIRLNVTNNTNEKMYVTTNDFKIFSKNTNKELTDSKIKQKLFPPDNEANGNYILICILYPNFNKQNEDNESLDVEINMNIDCAKNNSCWNVVEHCCYEFSQDEQRVNEELKKIDNDFDKNDFKLLDAQRYYNTNDIIMKLKTNGIFTNRQLVFKACQYIIEQLSKIIQNLEPKNEIKSKEETIFNSVNGEKSLNELKKLQNKYCNIYKEDDFYVFELKDDDYTIGKLIEKYLYNMFEQKVSFIGFKKEHPTKKEAYIFIKYKKNISDFNDVYDDLLKVTNTILIDFQHIQNNFN